jgi:hypothetical protein
MCVLPAWQVSLVDLKTTRYDVEVAGSTEPPGVRKRSTPRSTEDEEVFNNLLAEMTPDGNNVGRSSGGAQLHRGVLADGWGPYLKRSLKVGGHSRQSHSRLCLTSLRIMM